MSFFSKELDSADGILNNLDGVLDDTVGVLDGLDGVLDGLDGVLDDAADDKGREKGNIKIIDFFLFFISFLILV